MTKIVVSLIYLFYTKINYNCEVHHIKLESIEGVNLLFKQPLKMFRGVGYAEGISFLLLLGIAMPLKYMLDMPLAVTIVGAIHGGLFVLYIAVILYVTLVKKWSFLKAFLAVVSSVIPFGPFIFDAKLINNSEA